MRSPGGENQGSQRLVPASDGAVVEVEMVPSQQSVVAGILGHDRWPPHGYTNYVPDSAGIEQNTFKASLEANNILVDQANQCYSLVREAISRVRSAPYEVPCTPVASQSAGASVAGPVSPQPMEVSGGTLPPSSWPDGAAIPAEIVAKFPELASDPAN